MDEVVVYLLGVLKFIVLPLEERGPVIFAGNVVVAPPVKWFNLVHNNMPTKLIILSKNSGKVEDSELLFYRTLVDHVVLIVGSIMPHQSSASLAKW